MGLNKYDLINLALATFEQITILAGFLVVLATLNSTAERVGKLEAKPLLTPQEKLLLQRLRKRRLWFKLLSIPLIVMDAIINLGQISAFTLADVSAIACGAAMVVIIFFALFLIGRWVESPRKYEKELLQETTMPYAPGTMIETHKDKADTNKNNKSEKH